MSEITERDRKAMDSQPHLSSNRKSGQPRAFIAQLVRAHTLPAFFIIGAQKAGTTSLASYLAAHPCVVSPKWKEVHFFDLNYAKGIEWYRSHFPIGGRRRLGSHLRRRRLLAFDATPYYIFHPQTASRVSRAIPNARMIVLLRDPVDRAYSHYHHEVRLGNENLSFGDALKEETTRLAGEAQRFESEPFYESFSYQHFSYLARGVYSDQLNRWLEYFQPHQFLILSSEMFFENPANEYRRVLKFLGLPPWELRSYRPEHVGSYRPMPQTTRDCLLEYYAPHNRALRHHLNSIWPGTGNEIVDRFAG